MYFKKKINQFQTDSQLEYSGIGELSEIDATLKRYNTNLVEVMFREITFLGVKDFKTIVDFGAGIGTLANIWRNNYGIEPICIEIDPTLIQTLKAQNFQSYQSTDELEFQPKIVYSSNVFEHIQDDGYAMRQINEKMHPEGILALYLPANKLLFSELDRRFGHYRRYTKKELIQKVEDAGFSVKEIFYHDSVGVLASLAVKVFGLNTKSGLGTTKSLEFYDKYVFPISRKFDELFFRRIIGKNLFVFAVKKL
jgi:2-polyprenyl-3-methyl-5-hydroxy-6-metoxy-1,4-benzoquinol methylase